MRKTLLLIPALALTACATPREQCVAQATSQVRILQAQINETRANISRGYALETYQEVRTVDRICSGTTASGESFTYDCPDIRTIDRQRPVSINMADEREKLADLESRFIEANRMADAAVQRCVAAYPE